MRFLQVSGTRPVIPSDLSTDLADIITTCWAHNPQDRPAFTDVLPRLESFMSALVRQNKAQQAATEQHTGTQEGATTEWPFADMATTTAVTSSQNITKWVKQ